MAIWLPRDISDEPQIVLYNWQIVQIDYGTRHFVGYRRGLREGRVSSDIVEFDREKQGGVTASGRVYLLKGPPPPYGHCDQDAEYVWRRWLSRSGAESFEVVSEAALRGE